MLHKHKIRTILRNPEIFGHGDGVERENEEVGS